MCRSQMDNKAPQTGLIIDDLDYKVLSYLQSYLSLRLQLIDGGNFNKFSTNIW